MMISNMQELDNEYVSSTVENHLNRDNTIIYKEKKMNNVFMPIQLINDADRQFDNIRKYEKILHDNDFIVTLDEECQEHNDLISLQNLSVSTVNGNGVVTTKIYEDIQSIEVSNELNNFMLSENKVNYQYFPNKMYGKVDSSSNCDDELNEPNLEIYPNSSACLQSNHFQNSELINSTDDIMKNKKLKSNRNNKDINKSDWNEIIDVKISSELPVNSDKNVKLTLDDNIMEYVCPSCKICFDKGKKRKVIDICGHARCCSCMYREEHCPICSDNNKLRDYESGIGGSTSTIVSPLGSPKPQLKLVSLSEESTLTPIKIFEKNNSADNSTAGRLKFFNSANVKNSFGKGHRRTVSNGYSKGQDSSLLQISVCSDSVNTRRRKSAFNNFTSFSLDNKSNPLSLVSAGFGKIKSLWNAQSYSINAGLNQLAGNKIYQDNLQEKVTFLTEKSKDKKIIIRDPHEQLSLLTDSSESEISGMLPQQNIDYESKSAIDFDCYNTVPIDYKSNDDIRNSRKYTRRRTRTLKLKNAEIKDEIIQTQTPLNLKPLFFEVPHSEPDLIFIGRQWILRELSNILTVTETLGVLINGKSGTGKTALILQLVEFSCFGRKKNYYLPENDGIYCQINIGHDRIKALASYVVAYHFCQADNNLTCQVPDFIHSIGAQLCQAPQLTAYREYLEGEQDLQKFLGIKECYANPERAMRMAILEPLGHLKTSGKISAKCCVILIDALCEAEYHRPDYGYTIASFLSKMSNFFPPWLKIISTVRTNMKEHIKGLPYTYLTLDLIDTNDCIEKDILDYITFRINHSPDIQKNIGSSRDNNTAQYKLINHIVTLSSGSFLFCKLLIDFIEKGYLVIKSSSYKILPVTLSEIFLLHCNLRFQTSTTFEKVTPILNVCLSSLYPLTLEDIYFSISALSINKYIDGNEFLARFKLLNGFLIQRQDNTYMFFHPSFREWLIRRDFNESTKFLCDFREGHAALAIRLSRMESYLNPEKTLELCHHILKAHIFRNNPSQLTARDIQPYWVSSVSESTSAALCILKNIYSPNIKVSRFLLLAGASPDFCTDYVGRATILCMAAYEGIVPLVSLLLEFGANVNKTNSQGCTPLILAAIKGHCDVIRLLIAAGSDISQKDITQQCALVHAARNGKINVVKYLLACQCSLYINSVNHVVFEDDLLQALVAAAAYDYINIVEDILDMDRVDINGIDKISGETALTMAATNGCIECVVLLMARGADIDVKNKQEYAAILLAVKGGHLSITEKLLQNIINVDQTENFSKKTPFIIAAEEGHLSILHLLVKKAPEIEAEDNEGLTALSWACLRCHYEVVKTLITLGCCTQHEDSAGRSLLDLAAYQGTPDLVYILLEHGLKIEHVDNNGMRPLDRAIACRNRNVVQIFLKKGAKLGPATWAMASGKKDIFIILINKLLEDGNVLYKKKKYEDAAHRYQYALDKVSLNFVVLERSYIFIQLKVNLLLNLSRTKRKTNELAEAIDLATQAIELKPCYYEGYYARAKAKLQKKYLNEAYADASTAIEKSTTETIEVKRILQQFYEDIYSEILKNGLNFFNEVSDL